MRLQYNLMEGGLQQQFQDSRAKIQIFGGGFGNGKTTAAVIKTLQCARDYPGANILLARSTYPKLNDTLRKEFLKWCPKAWIERQNLSQDNVVELKNGTVINFRYIAQQGKNTESSTSNLLSATYDLIVVDQMEDPEITEKDFNDLLGRLRGNAAYTGSDPTMPSSGPRWFIIMVNPTRNWVFKKLVKPLQDRKVGIANPDLIVDADGNPMVELFEGSTYTNKENLPEDFIATLEATYKGQMKERFLLGLWGAFEGLVYPMYDPQVHVMSHGDMMAYLDKLLMEHYVPTWIESYDHGIAVQSCYSLAFVDHDNNVFDLDGFYEKEQTIEQLADRIKAIRRTYKDFVNPNELRPILADPQIFRRTSGSAKVVGVSVAGMFNELGIRMQRANNDIISGVAKVQSYLSLDRGHKHPITGVYEAPRLYFSANQPWIDQEVVDYIWHRDTRGEYEDKPMDRNDHAMDRVKYMLTHRPRIAMLKPPKPIIPPKYMKWGEQSDNNDPVNARRHRHAA